MTISYIFQIKLMLIMIVGGIILGIIYGILNITNIIKQKFILQIIADLIFSFTNIVFFIILLNYINMGKFRLYFLISYIIGFAIERITLGKLFAKGYKSVYTLIKRSLKKFRNSKFGGIIFK